LLTLCRVAQQSRRRRLYLEGLLQHMRKAAARAVQTFPFARKILALDGQYRAWPGEGSLASGLGDALLYSFSGFARSQREYAWLPRFSRHWDEASSKAL